MKRTRKFAAFVASILAVACMAAPMATSFSVEAVAAANTISFSDEVANSGHTYTAYQIFAGTVETKTGESGGTTTELTGIQWANPTGASAFLTALKADSTIGSDFTSCSNAAEVAAKLGEYGNNSNKAKAFAKLVVAQKDNLKVVNNTASATITAADDGYYVIVESSMTGIPTNSAMTSYLLAVYDASEGAEISVKSAIPSVEKKIQENVKTGTSWQDDATYGERYNDTADFSIGDTVPFKLYGTMPSNIAEYNTYKYIFHDTLGKEFTLAEGFATSGVTVTIDGNTIDSSCYNVTATGGGEDANTITVTFDNIKAATSESTAVTLTDDSKVVVSYSATLNSNAVIGRPGQENAVYLEYSNNPNNGGSGETDTTSKTPVDEVIAFTYELDVTKVDGANTEIKLAGAEFKLQATNGAHANKWVTVDTNGKVTGWVDSKDGASVLTSAADGTFKIIGLDDGAYSLEETKAPNGYNILTDPVKFTISANTNNTQSDNTIDGEELTELNIKVGTNPSANGALDSGAVAMTVENNSGSSLPSTGGIGTTIFYAGGGALVVGAGVLLIAKKRMSNK
ncbi:MAG: isopeptide-forming domain-containing fimbrial protein [Ruminococcus sp.]